MMMTVLSNPWWLLCRSRWDVSDVPVWLLCYEAFLHVFVFSV